MKKVLSDHKQVGKKFIPPFKYRIGGTEINFIQRILPEIVWIGYFLHILGKKGVRTAIEFGKVCSDSKNRAEVKGFPLISCFRNYSQNEWKCIAKALQQKQLDVLCKQALAPFVRAYPKNNPFCNLLDSEGTSSPSQTDIETARAVVESLIYRRSEEASKAQAVVQYLEIETGRLKDSPTCPFVDLNPIFNSFGSPEAERACANVRMGLNQVFAFFQNEIGEEWAKYFWNRGKELVPLKLDIEIPTLPNEIKLHPLQKFCIEYEIHCRNCLEEIWMKLPIDIYESETFEVIGALLSRQCNLAVKITRNPDMWDWYCSPIFLRAMTDNYITTAWILKDPLDRARKFILYGLGQEKLQIEHLKTQRDQISDSDQKNSFDRMIEGMEAWVNAQHYTFLQEVDVGSWSGIDTRKMAEQAGCLDLYRFAYSPWSQAAHSIWNHIGKLDSRPSFDPLHKCIQQPFHIELEEEIDVIVNATKYFNKSCACVMDHFGLKLNLKMPYDWLIEKLEELEKGQ